MKNSNNSNNHEYYEMLISCQMDGELSKEEELELEEHLATCEHCRALQAKFRGLSSVLDGSTIVVDTEAEKTDGSKTYIDFHRKHFPIMKAAACVLIMLALSITTFVGINNHNRTSINLASSSGGYEVYEGAPLMSDTFVAYMDGEENLSTDYEEYSPLFAYFSYIDD